MDNIAIIRLSSLGDIVLTEPVTRILKNSYPNCSIHYITRKSYISLLEMFSMVDSIIPLEIPGQHETIINLQNKIKTITESFDLVFDLHKNLRSRVISNILRSKSRIVYNKNHFTRLWSVWRKNKKVKKHTLDRYLEPLAKIGIETKKLYPHLKIDEEILHKAKEFLEGNKLEKDKFFVLAVGASFPPKQYPLEQFAVLAQLLIKKYGYRILVVDQKDRSRFRQYFDLDTNRMIDFGIGLELKTLAGILSMARATISNDSGVMHISSAVDTPTIGLFGPTHPVLGFSPLGEKAVALTTEEKCAPCSLHGKSKCYRDEQYCFINLQPDMIISKLDEMIG